MAKTPKTNATPTTDAPVTETNVLDFVIADPVDATRSVRFGDLPVVSQVRMVRKAVNELLSDSGAFSKEQLSKWTEDEAKAKKAESREKRWNSLLTGEFSVGIRGPRLSPVDAELKAMALAAIRKAWDAKVSAGKIAKDAPFPKGETLQKYVDSWNTRNPGARQVAESIVAARAGASESADDLLGDM